MARYYRRRYRTVVRAPRKKWASNMMNVNLGIANTGSASTSGYAAIVLAQNKTETTAPTPVVVKTGNFRLQGDFKAESEVSMTSNISGTLYIIYVPQGIEPQTVNAAEALVQNHPEWIMAWRVLEGGDTNSTGTLDSARFTLTSRLKRNLNSGDSVYALLITEQILPRVAISVKGKCQFWTCAN